MIIGCEGEVIFINGDSVKNSPNSSIASVSLLDDEKASSVACCAKSVNLRQLKQCLKYLFYFGIIIHNEQYIYLMQNKPLIMILKNKLTLFSIQKQKKNKIHQKDQKLCSLRKKTNYFLYDNLFKSFIDFYFIKKMF